MKKGSYEVPETKLYWISFKANLMYTSGDYGQAGKAGNILSEEEGYEI